MNLDHKKVVISGSAVLKKLNWTKYKNGIWQTIIDQDLVFDELFVNGKLQRMARYPNYNSSAHYYGGTSDDVLSPERVALGNRRLEAMCMPYIRQNGEMFTML